MTRTSYVDVPGPAGPIRCALVSPDAPGPHPSVLFYSDIFQLTGPHLRLAARLAERGYDVLAPELYGRFEPAGTVLDFERDRQRALDDSGRVRVEDVDADRDALIGWLAARGPRVCAAGWCFGGHLAFRTAYDARVSRVACFYPTTVHAEKLGASEPVDTLARAKELAAPLLLVWGSRDPHIPAEGRARIHAALDACGARYETRSFDAEHAFMRDEGPRYQPTATDEAFEGMLAFFGRG